MVIDLTNRCEEGCSHCFIDCKPTGIDMSDKTLIQLVNFLNKAQPLAISVSGGEFTLHPEFVKYIRYIIDNTKGFAVILMSNGSFFFDQKKRDKIIRLLDYSERIPFLQIRTHKKYYPNYERTIGAKADMEKAHSKIKVYDDGIEGIIPIARGKNLAESKNYNKSPMCSNTILLNAQMNFSSFSQFIQTYQTRVMNFCKPSISVEGFIHAGETPTCAKVGHISDNMATIMANIKNHKVCGGCGLSFNLNNIKTYNK